MYLLEETEEAEKMRQNVINLLESNEIATQEMALQMIEGGGTHSDFFVLLWVFSFLNYERREISTKDADKLAKKSYAILNKAIKDATQKVLLWNHHQNTKKYTPTEIQYLEISEEDLNKISSIKGFEWHKLIRYFLPIIKRKTQQVNVFWKNSDGYTKDFWYALIGNSNRLDIHNTEITSIPEEIKYFTNLETIIFDRSKIEKVAEELYHLPNLKYLYYENTPISKGGRFFKLIISKSKKLASYIIYEKIRYEYQSNFKNPKKYNILEKCLTFNPNHIEALEKKYSFLFSEKRYEEALETILRILNIEPLFEKGQGQMNCLSLFVKANKYEEGLEFEANVTQELFDKITVTTIKSNILFYKALMQFWLKRYSECIKTNFIALQLNNYAGTHYNIACAYAKMPHQKENMLKYLESTLKLNAEHYIKMATIDEDGDFTDYKEDEDFKAMLKKYE